MLRRTLVTGAAIMATAAAVAPSAMAGEDDQAPPPAPPPVTETVPAPPPPPVTVTVPAPPPEQPAAAPAPAPQPQTETQQGGGSPGGSESGGSESGGSASKPRTRVVVRYRTRTVFVRGGTDTGTVPSGGIQAGAGGTASDSHTPLTLGLASGGLAFLLTAGGLARRRARTQS